MKKIVVGLVFVLGMVASSHALVHQTEGERAVAARAGKRTHSTFPAAGCRLEGPRPYPGFVGPMPPRRCKASELRGRHHD